MRIHNLVFSAVLALAAGAISSSASAWTHLGVGTHFGQTAKTPPDLYLTEQGKRWFDSTRDEVYWGDVEREQGEFVIWGKALQSLNQLKAFADAGEPPVVVLSYGNRMYDGGSQPYTEEGRAAFARYAAWIARQMGNKPVYLEIWNEWNQGSGAKPPRKTGSPSDYVALVKAARKAIKAVNPQAIVVGGALADDLGGWPWLKAALDAGLLGVSDAISVHLYNYSAGLRKGGDAEFIARLRELDGLLTQANRGRPVPVLVTEIGWPNHQGKGQVSLDVSAAMAVRFLVSSMSIKSLEGIWLYELFDGGTRTDEREDNFGLLYRDGRDKPVACAVRALRPLLRGAKLTQSSAQGALQHHAFDLPDGRKLEASWLADWDASAQAPSPLPVRPGFSTRSLPLSCDLSAAPEASRQVIGVMPTILVFTPQSAAKSPSAAPTR
jgi:hypothetical protein